MLGWVHQDDAALIEQALVALTRMVRSPRFLNASQVPRSEQVGVDAEAMLRAALMPWPIPCTGALVGRDVDVRLLPQRKLCHMCAERSPRETKGDDRLIV